MDRRSIGVDLDNYDELLGARHDDLSAVLLAWAVARTANMSLARGQFAGDRTFDAATAAGPLEQRAEVSPSRQRVAPPGSASSFSSVPWNICRCSAIIASLLGAELRALQACQLEPHLLDLPLAPVRDPCAESAFSGPGGPVLADRCAEYLRGQRRDGLMGQALQVLWFEVTDAQH